MPWVDFTRIPQAIRAFGDDFPEVEVEVHSLTAPEQVTALRQGRIDIGVTRPPVRAADLKIEPLLTEPLVVVFPRRHALASYRWVPWAMLEAQPYISFSGRRAPGFDAVIGHACRQAGITLRVRHEADHPQTVLALVEAGVGVTLAPASFARVGRPGITYRHLRPIGPSLETMLAWRRDRQSPTVTAFLGVVHKTLGRSRGTVSSGVVR